MIRPQPLESAAGALALALHQTPPMRSTPSNSNAASLSTLADVTRDHVLMVLEACGGKQTLAATVLKIDRKTIYRMLRRWGVDARATRPNLEVEVSSMSLG